MNRILMMVLVWASLAPGVLAAHEGHPHKLMGVLSAVRGSELDVKSTDGKTSTVTLRSDAKIRRDATPLKPSDLKTGDRVVVTFVEKKGPNGKTISEASEIRVGTSDRAGASN
jgi:hypothetical protein